MAAKVLRHVEFYNPETNTSCEHEWPYLPSGGGRRYHTSVEGVLCGGAVRGAYTSCVDKYSGTWSGDKYEEIRPRDGHVKWNTNPGESFMLLGGSDIESKNTSDVVYLNGTVKPGFKLQYETR